MCEPDGLILRCEGAAEAVGGEGGHARDDEAIGGEGLVDGQLEEVVGDGCCRSVGVGFDGDGGESAAEEAGAEGEEFFGDEGTEGGHAVVHDASGDGVLAVEFRGGRAGSRGEWEEMEVGEGLRGDEVVALAEERVGFAGESDHDVGADGGVGEKLANRGEFFGVVPGTIAAVHAAEDGVGAGLEGEVGVAREARHSSGQRMADSVQGGGFCCKFAVEAEKVGGPVHGFDGAETEAGETGLGEDGGY